MTTRIASIVLGAVAALALTAAPASAKTCPKPERAGATSLTATPLGDADQLSCPFARRVVTTWIGNRRPPRVLVRGIVFSCRDRVIQGGYRLRCQGAGNVVKATIPAD